MAFLVAGMATAQITNIDKLRLNDIEEKIANDMVLTVDATGLVAWKNQTDITPDMSAYYTKTEIDAFFDNLTYADIVDAPTALSEFTNDTEFITIGDVPVYTEGAGLDLVGGEFRIKQTVLDEITANTNKTLSQVTSQGNTTDIKIKGSSVFTNTADEDYAQIKNVNDAGHSLKPLQAEMKIALMAKDGTTVLSEADLSWLATGDLAIIIDDTDPENPELVFTQGGLEVARIPASTLLTGVARSADLSGYKIQFKDGSNTVVYSVDLQALFDAKQDLIISSADIVPNGSNKLDLSTSVKSDIAEGVTAHGWGNFRDYGLGAVATGSIISIDDLTVNQPNSFFRVLGNTPGAPTNDSYFGVNFGVGASTERAVLLARLQNNTNDFYLAAKTSGNFNYKKLWHDGNLPNPATETYVDNAITAIPPTDLSGYYNKTESDTRFLRLQTDQTVEGAITFTQNITVPTPVNPNDAVNKKYVDDLITDFIIIKNPDNTNDWLELNDFARGWVTPNVYVEGTWKGTDNPSQANIKIPANWSKTIILN